jgi:transcriptional regulator GlxA family with amidase domain
MQGKRKYFDVKLVGLTKETSLNGGQYTIGSDLLLSEVKETDLIIIPIICEGFVQAINANKDFIEWLKNYHRKGVEIACLCVGSIILAATGLLNMKNCAVHWGAIDEFHKLYPNVNLVNDKIITDENGIYTCGGAFTYLSLILYLIEKFVNRELAVFASKMFEIDLARNSQLPFLIFMGRKDHNDEIVKKAQVYIETNIREKITVAGLTAFLGVNRRSFQRRFKKATANTIIGYTQRVKIEAVKNELETTKKSISEIILNVGYSDLKAFRSIFKKHTGLSPNEYKVKFSIKKLHHSVF